MKEPEQHFSPESIDQQTERFFGELPAQESRLIADLYQAYMPDAEEHSRSLQRIWNRFAQVQESQSRPGSTHLSTKGARDINAHAGHPGAPVPGSFRQPPQPLPRRPRRSLWHGLSGGMAVAVVLLIVLSWVLLTHTFPKGSPHTTLGASLTLDGGPHLNQNIVFLVKSSESGQYLATISFDTYDGHAWHNAAVSSSQLPANKRTTSEGFPVHLVIQQITVVNPSGEQQPYIIGAGQIASVDQPTTLLIDKTTGSLLAVLRNNDQPLATVDHYTLQSYVSSADITMLRSIPLPANAPSFTPDPAHPDLLPPVTWYDPTILNADLQLPKNLDPKIKQLAESITAGYSTMYDKAKALENYLHDHYTYNVNVSLPPGQEGVSWFLFNSDNQGFCNYFATAMAIMARELGIPARVVAGYTSGTYDVKQHAWLIHGFDAHLWTQVYFAGYGWVNFEPSASFAPFTRPLVTNGTNILPSRP